MANNVPITAGSGTSIATRDTGSVHFQQVDASADRLATATLANVSSSASSVTLAASNTARTALYVFNDSSEVLYIKFGTTASATSFTVKVAGGGFWEMPNRPIYNGIVTGIWPAATGAARVTEI